MNCDKPNVKEVDNQQALSKNIYFKAAITVTLTSFPE